MFRQRWDIDSHFLYCVSFIFLRQVILLLTILFSYLVHSSFIVMFPLHLLYLTSRSGYTRSSLLKGLSLAITDQLSSSGTPASSFPYYSLARVSLLVFFGLTTPALLWFAAVSLAP